MMPSTRVSFVLLLLWGISQELPHSLLVDSFQFALAAGAMLFSLEGLYENFRKN